MKTLAKAIALLTLDLTVAGAARAAAPDPMARYLTDLEKAGVVAADDQPATVETIRAALVAAETDLVTGNAEIA
ncbi:MAG: hypothetical protein ABUL67_00820, partial [Haliangium ochraceum]